VKGRVVILGQIAGREAAAFMVDGRLENLAIASPDAAPPAPGAIIRAIVDRPVKGLGGVFVKLPGGSGFLRQVGGLRPGQPVLVQVAGVAEPGKAVPVVTRLLFKGRCAILSPGAPGLNIARGIRDPAIQARLGALAEGGMAGADPTLGLILRSAAADASDDEIAGELAELRILAEAVLADQAGPPELLVDAPGPYDLAARDWSHPVPDALEEGEAAFAIHGVEDAIVALLRPLAELPGGAGMAVEPTRALVAVDVNTGPDTSPAAALKANIAAARELPRQLRLRGLGGQIVIDFAPSAKRDRHVIEQTLKSAFRADGADTALAGWTPLGLYELQRRRDRMPLATALRGWSR
jgi:ribonuclease G